MITMHANLLKSKPTNNESLTKKTLKNSISSQVYYKKVKTFSYVG